MNIALNFLGEQAWKATAMFWSGMLMHSGQPVTFSLKSGIQDAISNST